ncbi:unnamed protein product [Amoebophrya sp. A120]|nr:unnamed protein product [Amoebophrya sp. A120]|eukprot:GSA120T00025738001.1
MLACAIGAGNPSCRQKLKCCAVLVSTIVAVYLIGSGFLWYYPPSVWWHRWMLCDRWRWPPSVAFADDAYPNEPPWITTREMAAVLLYRAPTHFVDYVVRSPRKFLHDVSASLAALLGFRFGDVVPLHLPLRIRSSDKKTMREDADAEDPFSIDEAAPILKNAKDGALDEAKLELRLPSTSSITSTKTEENKQRRRRRKFVYRSKMGQQCAEQFHAAARTQPVPGSGAQAREHEDRCRAGGPGRGGHQPVVVTAYFDMGRVSRGPCKYLSMMRQVLGIRRPVVAFTQPRFAETIREIRREALAAGRVGKGNLSTSKTAATNTPGDDENGHRAAKAADDGPRKTTTPAHKDTSQTAAATSRTSSVNTPRTSSRAGSLSSLWAWITTPGSWFRRKSTFQQPERRGDTEDDESEIALFHLVAIDSWTDFPGTAEFREQMWLNAMNPWHYLQLIWRQSHGLNRYGGWLETTVPEYGLLQHAKVEFVRRAMELVPTASHFFWVDAGAMHGQVAFARNWCPRRAMLEGADDKENKAIGGGVVTLIAQPDNFLKQLIIALTQQPDLPLARVEDFAHPEFQKRLRMHLGSHDFKRGNTTTDVTRPGSLVEDLSAEARARAESRYWMFVQHIEQPVGTFWGGPKEALLRFHAKYLALVRELTFQKKRTDDDQALLWILWLRFPDMFQVLRIKLKLVSAPQPNL